MASDVNTEGFSPTTSYLRRSWALVSNEKGLVKVACLMALASLVPIVGPLGVLGYLYEWVRLVAWGADDAPKKRGVRIGNCIASGFRVACVAVVWWLAYTVVLWVLSRIPIVGSIVQALSSFLSIAFSIFVAVACLRATIYQSFVAGFRVKLIREMITRDWEGLLHIVGIRFLVGLVIVIVGVLVLIPVVAGSLPQLFRMMVYYSYWVTTSDILSLVGSMGLTLVVGGLIELAFREVGVLVETAALGLWMRQFNVATWGADGDPLPEPVALPEQGAEDPRPQSPLADEPAAAPAAPEVPSEPKTEPEPAPVEPAPEPAPSDEVPAEPEASEPEAPETDVE